MRFRSTMADVTADAEGSTAGETNELTNIFDNYMHSPITYLNGGEKNERTRLLGA